MWPGTGDAHDVVVRALCFRRRCRGVAWGLRFWSENYGFERLNSATDDSESAMHSTCRLLCWARCPPSRPSWPLLLMNPRLTRGEYWLLARAVLFRMPVRMLSIPEGPPFTDHTIQQVLNREGHGMSLSLLASTLMRMRRHGWIQLHASLRSESDDFADSKEAIRAELAVVRRFMEGAYYGLTPLGGEIWESFARPLWSLFIEDEDEPSCDEGVSMRHVITGDRELLRRYMSSVRHEVAIVAGSESVTEMTDWKPAYWKPPMTGIRWNFQCRELRFDPRYLVHSASSRFRRSWCEWI